MLGSNLRRDISYLDWGFVVLFSLPQKKKSTRMVLLYVGQTLAFLQKETGFKRGAIV
jgi:hypothetical protein